MGCIGIKRGIRLSVGIILIALLFIPLAQARFIQADPVVQSRYNPQSLNHYTYTLNNPYKYIDPDGAVVVGYRGFTQSSGENYDSIGINDIIYNSQFEDPSAAFSTGFEPYNDVKEGYDFVTDALSENPNQRVVIVGYSLGGARATELANKLSAEGVEVDLLATIDPYKPSGLPKPLSFAGGGQLKASGSIKAGLNQYQTKIAVPNLAGGTVKAANIKNVKVGGVNHFTIDDSPEAKQAVRNSINAVPVQRNREQAKRESKSILSRIGSAIKKILR